MIHETSNSAIDAPSVSFPNPHPGKHLSVTYGDGISLKNHFYSGQTETKAYTNFPVNTKTPAGGRLLRCEYMPQYGEPCWLIYLLKLGMKSPVHTNAYAHARAFATSLSGNKAPLVLEEKSYRW